MFLVNFYIYRTSCYECFVIGVYSSRQHARQAILDDIIVKLGDLSSLYNKATLLELIEQQNIDHLQYILSEVILKGWYKILYVELDQQVHYDPHVTSFHPTNAVEASLQSLNSIEQIRSFLLR